ncbi:MAG TPA: YdhR family protein [Solirubrobacteraceae bacterium]|nr:YdhR family protein [Solirubrobacteraceae bacterium]
MIVSIVRFRSRLSAEEVQGLFERRAQQYREVPGLAQKIYLRFRDTREWGAVYVFDSEQSLARFRESELAQSIASTYEVEEAARSELADVTLVVEQAGTEIGFA